MKTPPLLSEAQLLQWHEELEAMHKELRNGVVPLTAANVLTEQDVCALLKVTNRTVRKYRKQQFIGYTKMAGTIIYFRNLLYLDLVRLYYLNRSKQK